MTKKPVITASQLFGILFISRMIVNITYSPLMVGTTNMWDHVISAAISFIAVFILIIPMYKICTIRPNMTIADNSYFLLGKIGYILVIIYALYYLFVSCHTLSLFNVFITNVMNPNTPLIALSVAIILASCYGAYKGIEALARASGIILFIICIALIFLVAALLPHIDTVNYTPLMYSGTKQVSGGILLMLSRTSCIPAMAMLLPMVKGNIKKSIFVWNTATYAVVALLIFVMVGALGDYLRTQMFPVYTATNVAELGILKRLDALYLGIWASGLFIKISLFLLCFSLCMSRMFGDKIGRISILFGGTVVAVLSIIIAKFRYFYKYIYNLNFLLVLTIITGIIIPLILLAVDYIKIRMRADQNEK